MSTTDVQALITILLFVCANAMIRIGALHWRANIPDRTSRRCGLGVVVCMVGVVLVWTVPLMR